MNILYKYPCVFSVSCVMRKPAFCICENKDADQLRGNREADQRLCFRYIDSTISLPKFQASSHLLWLYSPVCVGNPEDWFSHNEARCVFIQSCGQSCSGHYLNMPMQYMYIVIFTATKNVKFPMKNSAIFRIFAQNID